jgi:ribosomal protein L24
MKSIKAGDRVTARRGASKGLEGTVIKILESYGPTCDGVRIWRAPLFACVKFREGATMYVRLSDLSV